MQRTDRQRKSIEVYCKHLAEQLNDKGLDVQTVIKAPVSLTQENVKTHLFKVIMKALYPDYISTTELTTTQCQEVYEHLNKITGERYGVSMDWPSIDSLYADSQMRFNTPPSVDISD